MPNRFNSLGNALMNALAYNIRDMRKDRGWSQQELADKVKVNRVTIARIEGGKRMPDWEFVCAVADAFGVSTDDLRNVSRKLQNTG